jgi:hypothetical protein
MRTIRRPLAPVIVIAICMQLARYIDRSSGLVERFFVIVVVLVVVHVDRTLYIDFVFVPHHDPDRIRDLEIHRDKAIRRQGHVLLDNLLGAGRDGCGQYQHNKQTVFHI